MAEPINLAKLHEMLQEIGCTVLYLRGDLLKLEVAVERAATLLNTPKKAGKHRA